MSESLQIALETMDGIVCNLIEDCVHLMMSDELTEKEKGRITAIRRMLYDIDSALAEMIW